MATEPGRYPFTDRHHAEEVLDALNAGVLVLDEALRVLEANSAAQDLLGVSLNQARGRRLNELLGAPPELWAVLQRALDDAEACAQREVILQPLLGNGGERVADVSVTPFDALRPSRRLLVEVSDATQRQRMSRETALLTQLGGSRLMLRQLAHEIKNPLGGLRGAAQLLERQLKGESMREYTEVIIGEADRLAALVDSMLGPGRAPVREALNVHELCEHVYHLMRSEAPSSVLIERDYDPSLPGAALDRHQIIQAMLNLGRNALQAVGTRGRIVLRTRALTNQSIGSARHRLVASIQFDDDGPGVPPEIRETLFYPLVTGRPDGTGLGLAVAQDLVIRHGGLIEFESHPGRTQFTILLPIENGNDR
ncbi:MAG TPA: nitrogen regulation protein NR(II) [Steroidobacteraceae bacterium]|nr:nitrogen regulation protein NR(II) [Steroidobacteraceae bacterium]